MRYSKDIYPECSIQYQAIEPGSISFILSILSVEFGHGDLHNNFFQHYLMLLLNQPEKFKIVKRGGEWMGGHLRRNLLFFLTIGISFFNSTKLNSAPLNSII